MFCLLLLRYISADIKRCVWGNVSLNQFFIHQICIYKCREIFRLKTLGANTRFNLLVVIFGGWVIRMVLTLFCGLYFSHSRLIICESSSPHPPQNYWGFVNRSLSTSDSPSISPDSTISQGLTQQPHGWPLPPTLIHSLPSSLSHLSETNLILSFSY